MRASFHAKLNEIDVAVSRRSELEFRMNVVILLRRDLSDEATKLLSDNTFTVELKLPLFAQSVL